MAYDDPDKCCFMLEQWSDDTKDAAVVETKLDVTADEVRRRFGLAPDEYPGDCLLVSDPSVATWLSELTGLEVIPKAERTYVSIYEKKVTP